MRCGVFALLLNEACLGGTGIFVAAHPAASSPAGGVRSRWTSASIWRNAALWLALFALGVAAFFALYVEGAC